MTGEWGRPEGAVELDYDARSHLLARGDEEFRVDALSRHFPRQETRAYAGGGRVTQAGNTTFEWDDAGQLLAKRKRDEDTGVIDEWRYRWNARRLLEAVTLPSGREVRFLYDPFGRRVEKAVYASGAPDATLVSCVTYHWFGNRVLHEVTYDSAAVTPPRERQWAYEDGSLSPFAVRDKTFDVSGVGLTSDPTLALGGGSAGAGGGGWLFQISTDNGFPEALVDGEGRVTNAFERSAFGKLNLGPRVRFGTRRAVKCNRALRRAGPRTQTSRAAKTRVCGRERPATRSARQWSGPKETSTRSSSVGPRCLWTGATRLARSVTSA